jgi:hypothetical protein
MLAIEDARGTSEVCRAERELIGIAYRKPKVFDRLAVVRSGWFRSWAMQQIWRAIQHCWDLNDGLVEWQLLCAWLSSNCQESEIPGLLELLESCSDEYLHAEHLDYHLAVLARAGRRLEFERWATHVIEMCRLGRAIGDIESAALTPPVTESGVSV